jgi:hypothetical protein
MAVIICGLFHLAKYLYIINNNNDMERMNDKKEK